MGNILSKKMKNINLDYKPKLLFSHLTELSSDDPSQTSFTKNSSKTIPTPPSYTLKRPENIDFDYKYFDIKEDEDFFFNKNREIKKKEKTS